MAQAQADIEEGKDDDKARKVSKYAVAQWLSGSVATGRGADVPTGLDVYMTALITGMDAMDGIAGTPHTNFHIFNNVKRKGCQFLTPSFSICDC